jgi:general secretion pathway protein J
LVAVAVFAALAAVAYGGLANVAHTRAALAERQDRFADVVRAISDLERDISQAVSRPVRGNHGELLPALLGSADRIELTRLGFANPRAEARSNLQRVGYRRVDHVLQRERWPVLDRSPRSTPHERPRIDEVKTWRLRYFGTDGAWRETWPPREQPAQAARDIDPDARLPRAIEIRMTLADLGELRRVIELPSSILATAAGAVRVPDTDDDDAGTAPPPTLPLPPGSSR